jgi:hypothetical protein
MTAALCVFISALAFGQSVNATVGGTVVDTSGALIPGVTVTATNTGTGIMNTVVTNESGAYNFAALQPGAYKVTAELPGFQTQTLTDVQLGGAQQVTLNFTLQVAAAAGTNVEVTIAADTVLATTSNSIGAILPEYRLRDLPAQTGNVFNLVQNLPGVQRDSTGEFGYMAGQQLGAVNATRDGINVNDGRYENGAWSVTYTPPDLVEEVKVVVAPVDAETSRGAGQVSMVTRSGSNNYAGSLFWTNHSSSLDANDWFNNKNGIGKSFDNRNLYGARFSGPIIKNKTFFFLLFDGQRDLKKTTATGLTLTDMAKAGIFRYWPGVDPANASTSNPSVDIHGNPVQPAGATGPLSAIDLFGNCTYQGVSVANCVPYRDPSGLRTSFSSSPFIQEWLRRMPSPNQFVSSGTGLGALNPDGLNTGVISFIRRQEGLDQTNGNGDEVDRDQYNARIDHNFNSREKLSLIATKEHTWGTATQAGLRSWPTGFDGLAVKRPYVYTIQLTSTLTNSLLNQLRLGKRASYNWQWGSADRGDAVGTQARALLPVANGTPYNITFATGVLTFDTIGQFGRWRVGINPMKSIGDDLSWTHGKHAFKTGYEWRRQESDGFNDPNYQPQVTLQSSSVPGSNSITGLDNSNPALKGLTTPAGTTARNLLADLAGSVARINQAFGIVSAANPALVTYPTLQNNDHHNYQSEMSAYFKDDWKFRPDLTLNLGIHWEYYGQPYEANGLAARIIGNQSAFFNVRCPSNIGQAPGTFDFTCSNLVNVQFVGRNSPHPGIGVNLKGNDLHSFGPSVGYAWTLPWFGNGKTVMRAGYGISFEGALRNFINVDSNINTVPGINLITNGSGQNFDPAAYTNLSSMQLPITLPPGTPAAAPFTIPTTNRQLAMNIYNYLNPYTENWNVELQREVAKDTTIEIRYIGSAGKKLNQAVGGAAEDLNAINALGRNKALFDAFNTVRAGGDSPLLTQMLMELNLGGGAQTVNGTYTGAMAVRANTTTRAQIATGSVGAFINQLNTATIPTAGNPLIATAACPVPTAQCNGNSATGAVLRYNGFPENYIVPSPQYTQVNSLGNITNATYNSMQLQVTRRLSHGFTNTTTWTWSKALGAPTAAALGALLGSPFIDPANRNAEKSLQAVDHLHQISSNGTYELPFGTGRFLLGNAPGWLREVVDKWQVGGIANFLTGAPLTLTTVSSGQTGIQTISTVNAKPDVVGSIPGDIGSISKLPNGVFYFNGYTQGTDPGFAAISPACAASISACNGLVAGYSNKAIVAPNGQTILVNPQPGGRGTLGFSTVRGPSFFDLDLNLVKRFRITETKQFELRLDVINALNHPNFAAPTLNINGAAGTFGQITSLAAGTNVGGNGGMRSFLLNTRVNF